MGSLWSLFSAATDEMANNDGTKNAKEHVNKVDGIQIKGNFWMAACLSFYDADMALTG